MKDILLLIDANSLIHRAYHALPPLTSKDGEPAGALYGLSSILLKVLKEGLDGASPNYVVAAFDTPEQTFRAKEYKDYKITRPTTPDDLVFQLKEARKLFKSFGIKIVELPGWEADDLIATLAAEFKNHEEIERVIIFSGDLDTMQMVENSVVAVVPQKGISNTVTYNEEAVLKRFGVGPAFIADYKGLVGDKSDNIPGVPGIGPKTASNLIGKFGSLENIYEELEGVGISDIKLQAKLKDYKEQALLSKKLALLDKKAPLKISLEDLTDFQEPDKKKINDLFDRLGFTSLTDRFGKL